MYKDKDVRIKSWEGKKDLSYLNPLLGAFWSIGQNHNSDHWNYLVGLSSHFCGSRRAKQIQKPKQAIKM